MEVLPWPASELLYHCGARYDEASDIFLTVQFKQYKEGNTHYQSNKAMLVLVILTLCSILVEFGCFYYAGVATRNTNHTRETRNMLEKHKPERTTCQLCNISKYGINSLRYSLALTCVSTRTSTRFHLH